MPLPLSRLLQPRELRFVYRRAGAVLGVGLLVGGWWVSPWSPADMDRAATLAASGHTDRAVAAYLEIAASPTFDGTRRDALWQAAWLASVDPAEPQRAVELLRDFIAYEPATDRTAQAWARLATIYGLYLDDPLRAGQAWEEAAALSPAAPEVGRWRLEAGLAYLGGGQEERAREALTAALATDQRVPAALALGRLTLASDPAVAYEHYNIALAAAATPADQSLARLGAATALEAMDRVDQAIAELDEHAEDDRVLRRRRARLEARERH